MYGIKRDQLEQLQKELREKATLLYRVDLGENKREIYAV